MVRKIEIPDSKTEVEIFITELAMFQKEAEEIENRLKKAVTALKIDADKRVKKINEIILRRVAAIYSFFLKNKKELTKDGKISIVKLSNGEMEVFLTNPTLNIRKEDQVITILKARGLGNQFIRTREEIIRDAVLQNPGAVADINGISITRKEKFLVRPNLTGESVTEEIKKLKKLLP
ncbi:MAG: host-nuclease inhibitor Gam family protein [Patescibacteria group bacterium]